MALLTIRARTVRGWVALVATLAVVTASCGAEIRIEIAGPVPPRATVTPAPTPTPTPAPEAPTVPADLAAELSLADTVELTRLDLERYWAVELPDLYGLAFTPVAEFRGYRPSNAASLPPCDGERGAPEDYFDNAFYCPSDDIISWDAEFLFPTLYDTYGDFAVALVLAHEYGHAIQERGGELAPTILLELQADCFAGAWAGALARGESELLSLVEDDLDEAIGGYLEFRDPIGTPADDPLAHGSGFDRITAFFDGFATGPEVCVDYDTDPPPITEIALDPADFETGGDLPLAELEPLVLDELAEYWSQLLGGGYERPAEIRFGPNTEWPACDGEVFPDDAYTESAIYCTADNAMLWDGRVLVPSLWNQVGDGASMYVLANLSAQSALVQRGDDVTDPSFMLTADCLTGAFNADLYLGNLTQLRISAGDLDETLVGLSLYEPFLPDAAGRVEAALPDRIAALRRGFDRGFAAC